MKKNKLHKVELTNFCTVEIYYLTTEQYKNLISFRDNCNSGPYVPPPYGLYLAMKNISPTEVIYRS